MRNFFFLLLLLGCGVLNAQQSAAPAHMKIVFDLASSDTADQAGVLRQFNNVLRQAPDTELEVVCHGPAIYMLVKEKSVFETRLQEALNKGKVSFKVCANSMKRLGVDASQILPLAQIVPVSILELAGKQSEGWAYIKAGH
jgi:hypothetical protein